MLDLLKCQHGLYYGKKEGVVPESVVSPIVGGLGQIPSSGLAAL